MIFNSVPFVVFFLVFFGLYWFVFNKSLKAQNLLLLAGCYFFYAWWDWRFLALLVAYSFFNYKLGYYIYKSESAKRKQYLTLLGSVVGLGLLAYFKYFNFFVSSFVSAFAYYHIRFDLPFLSTILPLGISFYTFRTLSYLYDIKNRKFTPTDDWVVFFSFVAFFPCLLAGPVDRPKTLIPQLSKARLFDFEKGADALRQILWGLFKKVVIADPLTLITNNVFDNYHNFHSRTFILGIFYYSIQMYADFSGYSDMAIGVARLLGFEVTKNFNYPFFAQNIAEYWRKWHISLTDWLTEYVFMPLSIRFRDWGNYGVILAVIINFTLIGMWHGANITYVVFGFLHGLYYIPLILNGTINKRKSAKTFSLLPGFKELLKMLQTFMLVNFALIIFRSNTMAEAFFVIRNIFSLSSFRHPVDISYSPLLIIFLFFIAEWVQRGKQYTLQIANLNPFLRFGIYYAVLLTTIAFSTSQITQFIYLKF